VLSNLFFQTNLVISRVEYPTCEDGIINQYETDIDCGGKNCPKCLRGEQCLVNSDCSSLHCDEGVCGTRIVLISLAYAY
jgi:hypothetical protein